VQLTSGSSSGFAIVIDIGKTLSKVTLWSRDGQMFDRQVYANQPCEVDAIRRLDAAGIGAWLLEALALYRDHPVEAIIPVGHGAGVAAIVDDALAFPPLDYEASIPEPVMQAYRAERDPFVRTGSPALPDGLNIGSQLFWLDLLYPETMASATLLPWAQYWAWFFAGVAVSEVTSLGCHSDLWLPEEAHFSPLAERMGWAAKFAPIVSASAEIGALRPEIAHATGLPASVKVLAGLHDSNAALLAARGFAEITGRESTILSTGTWFIAMRLPGSPFSIAALPEARDCLVNVDAYGSPVPSARFMGGREIESVIEIDSRRVDIKSDQPALLAAVPELLRSGTMLLPTLAPGCGSFPDRVSRWVGEPQGWCARRAAACLYAALVADTALDLIGSKERLLVEGRFAEAEVFVRALATLRPDTLVFTANAFNDVSFGALRLMDSSLTLGETLKAVQPLGGDLQTYRSRWRAELGNLA
jgi:sugar (pentulose or hexulose) kinase